MSELRRKRYDKYCWQVYRGGDLSCLIEAFANGQWGIFRLGGGGKLTELRFPNEKAAYEWLKTNADIAPL